ncbi:MAG TPA: BatA domain-containing protein [Saprospiraceae bacterium]|nr:BatA domain-containing protein [Saprospiraceae bacterium]MBK9743852.1 BatA domain-containing protein [Saprospiraceae bacterium]HMT52834.1 BatA domain-containing protein [Saprospiraceae bacterium]HMT68589.1 BatA domain-containing protein [Saprospiraceae bacterium]HQV65835.1 BatA domain-containing protein [Saprospiraceae bacterium]
MQFLYPSFLWALMALAIPIIIHLFYFRRFKRVLFTNVKYLKEIKEETSNRNRLKNLLVLLSRCLAVAGLVFAFAQPYLPTGDRIKSGINHISVFVDNSFSMTAARQDIPLLDFAKDKARLIINSYSEEDKFQVLSHDFEGKHQRFVSKEDALAFVDEIQITPTVQMVDKIVKRQHQLMETVSGNKISYIISDFQKSISDFSTITDTTMEVNLLPLQSVNQKNISVDSVWFDGPIPFFNQNNKLVVRVRNNSGEDSEQVKLSFKKDGQDKPIGIVDIPANSVITDTVSVNVDKAGWHEGIVSVTDYPIQFDDEYYIAFPVPDTIKALFINESGSNRFMDALFDGVPYFSLANQNVNQLQYQQFVNFDLIILNDLKNISSGLNNELSQYLKSGGKVLIFPGKTSDIPSYNNFMAINGAGTIIGTNKSVKEVASINTEEFIFSDVYINTSKNLKLPKTTLSFDINNSASGLQEKLLVYRDGTSYLSKYKVGDGQLFVCAAPLDKESNDLVYNAEVFVPLIYKMAITTTKHKNLSYTISNNLAIETDNLRQSGDYVYKIKNEKLEFIPGQIPSGNKITLEVDDQVKSAGFYDLMLNDQVTGKLAFNYNRRESDMSLYDESALAPLVSHNTKLKIMNEALQANISTSIAEKDRGVVLWKWFLIAALVFLAIEALLLRYYKP